MASISIAPISTPTANTSAWATLQGDEKVQNLTLSSGNIITLVTGVVAILIGLIALVIQGWKFLDRRKVVNRDAEMIVASSSNSVQSVPPATHAGSTTINHYNSFNILNTQSLPQPPAASRLPSGHCITKSATLPVQPFNNDRSLFTEDGRLGPQYSQLQALSTTVAHRRDPEW